MKYNIIIYISEAPGFHIHYNIYRRKFMSNIIRKLSLFLAAVSVFSLTSCGIIVINRDKLKDGDSDKESDISETNETTVPSVNVDPVRNNYEDQIEEALSSLPSISYNGAVFKITSPDVAAFDSEGDYEVLSEAAAKRNKRISDRYSISIVASRVDYSVLYAEVKSAANSGMYYADLLMLPQNMLAAFAAGGLLFNMRSMPSLDFTADYFNQSSVSAASGGFHSYAIAGDASVYPYSLPAVFFNKELCSAAGTDPYALVRSGEWTWDKFFELCICAADGNTTFGWGSTELGEAVYETVFTSVGSGMIDSGIMQVPSLAFDADSSAYAVDIIKKLFAEDRSIGVSDNAISSFADGNIVFQIERLSASTALKDTALSWGVLPIPNLNGGTEYISLSGDDCLMFTCPSTVSTPDKSSHILMALNASSAGEIKDAYIGYFQYNLLRDNESANMLDYIIDGVTYDFAYTYGNTYSSIANCTYELIRDTAVTSSDFASLIKKRQPALNRTFNSYFGLSN